MSLADSDWWPTVKSLVDSGLHVIVHVPKGSLGRSLIKKRNRISGKMLYIFECSGPCWHIVWASSQISDEIVMLLTGEPPIGEQPFHGVIPEG